MTLTRNAYTYATYEVIHKKTKSKTLKFFSMQSRRLTVC